MQEFRINSPKNRGLAEKNCIFAGIMVNGALSEEKNCTIAGIIGEHESHESVQSSTTRKAAKVQQL
ncbi:hypothetical protein D3C73_1522210 [compost metagenome]